MDVPQARRDSGEDRPELVCTQRTAGIKRLRLDIYCVDFRRILLFIVLILYVYCIFNRAKKM